VAQKSRDEATLLFARWLVLLGWIVAPWAAGVLAVAEADLVAQITHPPDGFKVQVGTDLVARARVEGDGHGVPVWSIAVRQSGQVDPLALAEGTGTVNDQPILSIPIAQLARGESYVVELVVRSGEREVIARSALLVPDYRFALIPLEEGNHSRQLFRIYTGSADGRVLVYAAAANDPERLTIFDRAESSRETVSVPLASNLVVLSGDGSRLFYPGRFPTGFGLGFLDLGARLARLLVADSPDLFSIDHPGRRLVYQGIAPSTGLQFFSYDDDNEVRRQLTDDPRAIIFSPDPTFCPLDTATRPLVTYDGGTVVMITSATLGVVDEDDSVGCRIFSYDVKSDTVQHVVSIESGKSLAGPALSHDGRWLSYLVVETRDGVRRGFAALLDLAAGEIQDPVVDVGPFTTFDSVVTGDGRGIVISSQADLDPRVGNADHNMELFLYDRVSGEFTQISATTLGVGASPGRCPSYAPYVSRDASVLMLPFYQRSIQPCTLDGWQRNERDNFAFRLARAVRVRPSNSPVRFEELSDEVVIAGDVLAIEAEATDPDGDPITFFAQVKDGIDVPPGSEMIDHHDGTATFRWPTKPEHAGEYVLRVAALDEGGGEVFQDVTISVVPRSGPTLTATTTRTATVTPTVTSTHTEEPAKNTLPTSTVPPRGEASPTATESCPGDCNGDGRVGVDEILMGTRIALGLGEVGDCPAFDCHGNGVVTIDCLTRGVAAAIDGCP
jgi:hypothetical protein